MHHLNIWSPAVPGRVQFISLIGILVGLFVSLTAQAFPVDMRVITGANQGWKSYADTGNSPPPVDWAANTFDDSSWSNARAPFPNPNAPAPSYLQTIIPAIPCGLGCTPLTAQFMWHDPNNASTDGNSSFSDAYFRKAFYLPVQADSLPLEAIARIQVDDDFEFLVNGNSVFLNNDQGYAGQIFSINFTGYLLQNQTNVIAIHAVDGGWGHPSNRSYADVLMDARIRSVPEPGVAELVGIAVLLGAIGFIGKRKLFR